MERLHKEGIEVRRPVFKPLHYYLPLNVKLPHTVKVWKSALSIPIYPALNDDNVKIVIEKVKKVFS